jgi:hypothetical protein
MVTSLSQLALGWLYAAGGSKTAWAGVMIAGAVTVCASLVLIAKDRRVYTNLYREK